MNDICIGPAGGCPYCYRGLHTGKTCEEHACELEAARQVDSESLPGRLEARASKLSKAHSESSIDVKLMREAARALRGIS